MATLSASFLRFSSDAKVSSDSSSASSVEDSSSSSPSSTITSTFQSLCFNRAAALSPHSVMAAWRVS